MLYGLLCLASFAEHVFEVRSLGGVNQNSIPFHGCIIFHCTDGPRLSIRVLMDTGLFPQACVFLTRVTGDFHEWAVWGHLNSGDIYVTHGLLPETRWTVSVTGIP